MVVRPRQLCVCAGLAAVAARLAMPGAAAAQTFGQILDSELTLESIGAPQGVRDRLRPELDPAPLRIDDVAISASLDGTLGSTSNVLGAQGQRQADGFAEWAPRLAAALDFGTRGAAQLSLGYDGKRFFATPAKRQDGHYAGVSSHYGFGSTGLLSVSTFQQRVYEDQLAGSFPATGGGAVAIDQTHAQVQLAQVFNRVRLSGAVAYDRLVYHDTVTTTGARLPQSGRDARVFRASARIDYTLPASAGLFAQLSWRGTDFAADSAYADRSSREWRAIFGVSADITGLVRLRGGIGGYGRQYAAPAAATPGFGKLSGFVWDVRGVYYASPLTTLSVLARREFVDANVARSPGYEATSLRVQLDHELLRNLLLSAAIGTEADRFRLALRHDRLHDLALWADWWRSPRLLVTPRVEWLDRASTGIDAGPQIPEIRTQLTLSVRH